MEAKKDELRLRPEVIRLLRIIEASPGHPGIAPVFPRNLRGFFRTAEKLGLAEFNDGWYLTSAGTKIVADFAELPRV